jgi:hypothetical protein
VNRRILLESHTLVNASLSDMKCNPEPLDFSDFALAGAVLFERGFVSIGPMDVGRTGLRNTVTWSNGDR